MKFNTIFMYDTYTYDMNNYDIKYNVEFVMLIIKYKNFPVKFHKEIFENLTCLLALWHIKLKIRHAVCHVNTFICTLARKNEELARFHVKHTSKQARCHVGQRSHAGMHDARFRKFGSSYL